MIQQKVRVGLLGVGLDTYWGQFEGLLPRLLTYQDEIAAKIEAMDVQVINTGIGFSVYFYLCSFFYDTTCSSTSRQAYYYIKYTACISNRLSKTQFNGG